MLFNLNSSSGVNVTEDWRSAKTTTAVSATSTVSVALAANASRATYSIYNTGTATVYVREGAVVTSTLYEFLIPPGYYWKDDFSNGVRYSGTISVITASGTASLMVSEGLLS